MNVNSQTILPSFSAVHNKKSDWLPSDVSISAWIDASDSENYTRSGTSLETVTDKSGSTDISDIEKAEGYLAHKWGLEGNLPDDHPYKNSAPTN